MAGTPTALDSAGYLGAAAGNLLGTGGSNTSTAANNVFSVGQFQPYSVNNPMGSTSFSNGAATSTLSPLQSQVQGLFGNQITSNLQSGQGTYNPNTSFLPQQYQSIFGNMQGNVSSMFNSLQAAQAPQTAQYLQSNLDNEQAKGTLASTAGSYQTAGAQTAANTQMNNNMAQAQQYALNNANSQFSAAANTQQQGEQQAEFAPQLNTQQNTADYTNLLNAGSQLNQQTSIGGSLGALQSSANTTAANPSFLAAQQQDQAQSGLLNGLLTGNGTGGLLGSLLGTTGTSSAAGGALGSLGGTAGNFLNSLLGSSGNTTGSSAAQSQYNADLQGNTFGSLGNNQQMTDPTPSDLDSQMQLTDQEMQSLFDGSFSGAGGQATNSGTSNSDVLSEVQSGGLDTLNQGGALNQSGALGHLQNSSSSLTGGLANAGAAYNIINGLRSGTATGEAGAAIGTAGLLNKNGLLGGSSSTNSQALGVAGAGLGIYSGLQQGGVAGYGGAAVSALRGGSSIAGLAGDSALSSGLSTAAGALAIPLSLYNFAKSYQSGDTGGDALSGAETGGTIGSVFGPIGTAVGAVIGGAVGALSSAFGAGKPDQETTANQNIDKSAPAGAVAGQSASTSFQYIAGVMDAKNNSAGHSEPIEQVFGRMGEGGLLDGIAGQVNSALQSGSITKSTSAADVYSKVISPWLTQKGAAIDPNAKDEKGNNEGQNLIASIQNLIGSYMGGSLTANTAIGITGQKDSSLPGLFSS